MLVGCILHPIIQSLDDIFYHICNKLLLNDQSINRVIIVQKQLLAPDFIKRYQI